MLLESCGFSVFHYNRALQCKPRTLVTEGERPKPVLRTEYLDWLSWTGIRQLGTALAERRLKKKRHNASNCSSSKSLAPKVQNPRCGVLDWFKHFIDDVGKNSYILAGCNYIQMTSLSDFIANWSFQVSQYGYFVLILLFRVCSCDTFLDVFYLFKQVYINSNLRRPIKKKNI